MLHTLCANCSTPTRLDAVHAWIDNAPACQQTCAEALTAAAPQREPQDHRKRAKHLIARARRDNDQSIALDVLAADRSAAAAKIIGLTKGARRRKRRLQGEAHEFSMQAEDARYGIEALFVPLIGHLMALREEVPGLLEPAIRIGTQFPANLAHPATDADLAAVEAHIDGEAPKPRFRAVAENGQERAERHVDAFCVYESQRLEAGGGRDPIWTLQACVEWDAFAAVECLDKTVHLKSADDRRLADFDGDEGNRERIFSWVREERPNFKTRSAR